jgi:hypothetical protein
MIVCVFIKIGMKELMEKFTLTEEGELGLTAMEYLGVQMTRTRNNKFVLNQPS